MADSVLIIEDDPTLLRAISRNLAARGYAVRGATTVAEARAAIVDALPIVVVADIDLPDGSGWEVVRWLRESGHAGVAVIVMSALRPNQRLAAELAVAGILEKPFPIDALLRLVAGQVRRAPRSHLDEARTPEG
jgi:DNA-binding response OmpR family regulator